MGSSLVDYRTQAGVALIELNDAPTNAYTHEMMKDLDEAILDARFDNDVHVIVLTGHGDRYFCSGANLQMLSEVDSTFKYYFGLHTSETLNRLEQTPKLVIAALNGHALAGGLEIALACDLRIARKDAGKVGVPEVSLGLLPGAGGVQRIARLIGRGQAMRLLTEGMHVDFEAARDIGLLHEIWETATVEEFHQRVFDYARKFLPPNKASLAVGAIKRSIREGTDMSFEQGQSFDRELEAQLWSTDDAREGVRAHLEKRRAYFRGK